MSRGGFNNWEFSRPVLFLPVITVLLFFAYVDNLKLLASEVAHSDNGLGEMIVLLSYVYLDRSFASLLFLLLLIFCGIPSFFINGLKLVGLLWLKGFEVLN
jgi:hypothetical protein